jgi:hypothetical protein
MGNIQGRQSQKNQLKMFEGEYDPESAWVFRMLDETEHLRNGNQINCKKIKSEKGSAGR